MSAVSSLGNFLTSISLIQSTETQVQNLSEQNATGLVSTSLEGYGSTSPLVLNLQSSIQENEAWIANSTEVNTYLTGYTSSLTQLSSDGTQLQSALAAIQSGGSAALSALSTLIKGLESDVTATLNTQVGNRYIYAGSRYDTAPTVDLTTLATPTTPTAISLASGGTTPPTIPDYDTAYAATNPPGTVANGAPYYAQHTVDVGDNESINYGVSADDPSIQQLVYALKQAEAGASDPSSATAKKFFANASAAVATAITGLTSLSEQNSAAATVVQQAQSVQKQSLSTMQSQLGDLTQVDAATVATELSSVENQLQGSYKATATLLNLSILNYLQ